MGGASHIHLSFAHAHADAQPSHQETGDTLFVGTSHGSVVACAVPGQLPTRGSADGVTTPLPAGHGQCRVDCLCPLAQHRIATKSSDGKCCVWDVSEAGAPKLVTSFKEPGAAKAAGSQVGCTPDGTVLLVGAWGQGTRLIKPPDLTCI